MDSFYEDSECLVKWIELARAMLHQMVVKGNQAVYDQEIVQLSQLLDQYIVHYTKGRDYKVRRNGHEFV